MKGKKAIRWPQAEIYVVICAIILIIGVVYVLKFGFAINFSIDFHTNDLDHRLISSRLINSADCLAWEEPYTDGGTEYLVHAGIIDISKYTVLRVKNCVEGKILLLSLEDFKGEPFEGSPRLSPGDPGENENFIEDYYLVKVKKADNSFSDALLKIKIWY